MLMRIHYAVGLFLLLFVTTLWAEIAVPPLSKHVTDLTATLTAEQISSLEDKLAAFETSKGSQIAVLILPTTQPEDIGAFGIRVADSWKIGRKAVDDGVILLVAKDDHKLRIEVGRGLEGVIPDAIAKRVIEEIITPKFKENDFMGGIDAGVSQLIGLIAGEKLPEISHAAASDAEILVIVIFVILILVVIGILIAAASGGSGNKKSRKRKNNGFWTNDSSSSDWSSSSSSSWGGGGGGFSGGGASGSW